MIINHTYRFIFVHVPKAAGTSITEALSPLTRYGDLEIGGTAFGEKVQSAYRSRFGLSKHASAARIMEVVGRQTWSAYKTFAVVRDPFARALSTYRFLRRWRGPDRRFHQTMREFASFDAFVRSGLWWKTHGPDGIFQPQVHWLHAAGGEGPPLPRFVGRVEALDEQFPHLLRWLGIPEEVARGLRLNRLNAAPEDAPRGWPADVARLVAARYRPDFDTLGYMIDPRVLGDTPSSSAIAATGEAPLPTIDPLEEGLR
jgi:hypothetical protein